MKKTLFALLLLTAACSKKDDSPSPSTTPTQAAFQVRLVNEINETVALSNSSSGAARYEWDFGNGQSSTIAAPTVVYSMPGNYTITLRAYNSTNQASTASIAVKVGKRYLKSVRITALSYTKPTGQTWNSSGGPNVYMKFGPTGTVYTGQTFSNVQPSQLPIVYTPTTGTNIEMQRGTSWNFTMYNHNTILSDDVMSSWALPIAEPTINRDANGNGFYTLTGPSTAPASYNVEVNYETR